MSSACANPVIYGFLNENFNKEFKAGVKTLTGQKCVSVKRDDLQFAIKPGLFLLSVNPPRGSIHSAN